jgi:hypothetical protein
MGHPMWPFRANHSPANPKKSMRDGDVYGRRKASTEKVSSAEVAMLSRRAAGSQRRLAGIRRRLGVDPQAILA